MPVTYTSISAVNDTSRKANNAIKATGKCPKSQTGPQESSEHSHTPVKQTAQTQMDPGLVFVTEPDPQAKEQLDNRYIRKWTKRQRSPSWRMISLAQCCY